VEDRPLKYIADEDGYSVVELTRRNLEVLLAKLDDPLSARSLLSQGIIARAVENDAHYADREPGSVYMPSSGEYI
jgi:hypothetical protein